ncbi:hypothetical protein Tco_0643585 [Tanacetum coccineum]
MGKMISTIDTVFGLWAEEKAARSFVEGSLRLMATKQQVRSFIAIEEKENGVQVMQSAGTADGQNDLHTKDTIWDVLKFPNTCEGMYEFEPFVKDKVLAQDIQMINRCNTWKKAGQDKCSIDTLMFFHGMAFDRHYDFADLILREFVSMVKVKNTYPNDSHMKKIVGNCRHETVIAARIQDRLLAYANPNAHGVIIYRSRFPSMVLTEPLEPPQEGMLVKVRLESGGAYEPESELLTGTRRNESSSNNNDGSDGNISNDGDRLSR